MSKPASPWAADWRDVARYPSPDEDRLAVPSAAWRWEFIRRNPVYCRDAATWNAMAQDQSRAFYEKHPYPGKTAWADPVQRLAVKQHWDEQLRLRGDPLAGPRKEIATRWGIRLGGDYLPDPSDEHGWRLLVFAGRTIIDPARSVYPVHLTPNQRATWDGRAITAEPASSVWLCFDLNDHIGKQLQNARAILEEKAERVGPPTHRKRDPAVLLRMLRVLDADGTPAAEIAAVLFPRVENIYPDYLGNAEVKKTRRAARAMLDSGFLRLSV